MSVLRSGTTSFLRRQFSHLWRYRISDGGLVLSLHPCEKDPEVVHKLKRVIQVHLTAEINKHDKQISKQIPITLKLCLEEYWKLPWCWTFQRNKRCLDGCPKLYFWNGWSLKFECTSKTSRTFCDNATLFMLLGFKGVLLCFFTFWILVSVYFLA